MKTLVTNAEIEEVGEGLIQKFIEAQEPPPNCIDIEGFIRNYLHLPVVYANFAEKDLDKIGFVSDGIYPLEIWENGRKRSIVYPKGTVVIDRFLLHTDKSAQRRYTLAHEAAHIIFERMSPTAAGPCFNRYFDIERKYDIQELREHLNLCESQTDRMGTVLLMPKFLVERQLKRFHQGKQITIYGSYAMRSNDKLCIQKMADCMGVSFTALRIRLRTLGMTDQRDITEYIDSELVF